MLVNIWKPLHTSPRYGIKFLVYKDGDITTAFWEKDNLIEDRLKGPSGYYPVNGMPSHWRPNLLSPEEEKQENTLFEVTREAFDEMFDNFFKYKNP